MKGGIKTAADFNPRSPYGERLVVRLDNTPAVEFQSTLPLRGATITPTLLDLWQHISIHAPLTGSDVYVISCIGGVDDFNPRSPYGERPFFRYS